MVTDVTGAGGTAQGGTIDLLASNGGLIQATSTTASSSFSTDAQSGASAGRADATGGTIQLIADAGTINFAALAELSADGTSGGDAGFSGGTIPLGRGGSVLLRTVSSAARRVGKACVSTGRSRWARYH